MDSKRTHKDLFKVFSYQIVTAGQIIHIDEKLPKHIFSLEAISYSCIPSHDTLEEISDIGELSLTANNRKNHIVHIGLSYLLVDLDTMDNSFRLGTKIIPGSHLKGYFRDSGNMRDRYTEFIPYKLKIILKCKEK